MAERTVHELRAGAIRVDGVPGIAPGSLVLERGSLTLVMGANGTGKTTFLEKLAGLREPESLDIRYGEHALWMKRKLTGGSRLSKEAIRSYSYACQSPEQLLFARSVEEELRYSLHSYRMSEAERMERVDGALHLVGWNREWLERDPYRLSGGERRRTALAAAIGVPAPWLLLDEPTAGLDGAGQEMLAARLREWKEKGVGILLISHDSDWALPLADQVLLLHDDAGRTFRLCKRDELLAEPSMLTDAGMAVPEWLIVANRAWRLGVPSSEVWEPRRVAQALASAGGSIEAPSNGIVNSNDHTLAERRSSQETVSRLMTFDPRSIWLGYLMVSIGLFSQSDWRGLAIGSVITLVLLAVGQVQVWRWRSLVFHFAMFSLIASAFASYANSRFARWDMSLFLDTLFPFARMIIMLLLGFGMIVAITPLRLRRSLEQLLSIRGRTPPMAQRFILTVALMVRFVPVLLQEWNRFRRLMLARGKQTSLTPHGIVSRLRDIALPYLLSLIRLGENAALALESRGVGRVPYPTRAETIQWGWRDWCWIAVAIGLTTILWLFR